MFLIFHISLKINGIIFGTYHASTISSMSVLILKNISYEGPGTISCFLDIWGIPYTVVDLSIGQKIPSLDQKDTLVIMGGPMSVNDGLSFIDTECKIARHFIEDGRRILGICLGAQIIARACGASVYPGPVQEIGWHNITLTPEGSADELMRALANNHITDSRETSLKVFQWHAETFDMPDTAVHLAFSSLYPHQAFRIGSHAYAFQFHIEVTKQMIYDWFKDEPAAPKTLMSDTESLYAAYHERAYAFYENFFCS
jgi:GMP synthase-like glutamine amidotransferase